MKVVREPYEYSFINQNNPVDFELTADSDAMLNIKISTGGKSFHLSAYPYSKNGEYRVTFEITDFLRSHTTSAFTESGVVSTGSLIQYTVTAGDYKFTGYAVPGGISKFLQRELNERGVNVFDYLFLDATKQFLFTTRTSERVIWLYRNEIQSIYYLSPGNAPIHVRSDAGETYSIPAYVKGTPVQVNLKLILNSFKNAKNIKSLHFFYNLVEVFLIRIKDRLLEESYLIKFRNSLGAFEWVEFHGRAYWNVEVASETTYNRYSELLRNSEKATKRETLTDYVDIETGYKTTDELRFLSDLLSSDERYLIIGSYNIPVIITATPEYAVRKIAPESFTARLELVDSDSNFSPKNIDVILSNFLTDNFGNQLTDNLDNRLTIN